MIEKLALVFVKYQLEIGMIQKEYMAVYQYGYTAMLEVILNICLSVFIGIILGQIKEIIFFLCMFIPLRSFSGGYHADKTWKCVVLSNFIVVFAVEAAKWMAAYEMSLPVTNTIILCSALMVAIISPIESQNKKLNAYEKKKYKYCSGMIIGVELALAVILIYTNLRVYYYIVVMVYIAQLISLFLAWCKSHFMIF